jgi:hypothetical protein
VLPSGSYFLGLQFSQLFSNLSAKESVFDVRANGLKLLTKFNVAREIHLRNSKIDSTSNVVEFSPGAGSFAFINAVEVVSVSGNSVFDSIHKVGGVG